jgi:hypothetical protein
MTEVDADDGSKRFATVLPGDAEYGGKLAGDKHARHRNYLAAPKPGKQALFGILGCQRRGVAPVLGEAWSKDLAVGNVFARLAKL